MKKVWLIALSVLSISLTACDKEDDMDVTPAPAATSSTDNDAPVDDNVPVESSEARVKK